MSPVEVKLTVHTLSRRLAKQIPLLWNPTHTQFMMMIPQGWIAADAIESGSPVYFLMKIGDTPYLVPYNSIASPTREHYKSTTQQIYLP